MYKKYKKTRYSGISQAKAKGDYKSKLEADVARLLKNYSLYEGYENEKFELIPSWRYTGLCVEKGVVKESHHIRAITITPDFCGRDFIIEAKGYPNESFAIRWKLFKWHIDRVNDKRMLFLVKSMKEAKIMVTEILKSRENDKLKGI